MTVKTAVVGYGYAGKTIHAPMVRAAKGLDLAAVVSSRPADVAADLPGVRVYSFDDTLADPAIELVLIATPNELHAPQAHAALDAGKHVAIDKPFCLDTSEACALAAHAEAAGRLLSVYHCRRWDGHHQTFQKIRNRLGDLYQVVLRYDRWRPEVRDRWRERGGPGSGIWYDLGSHLVDQALNLFGRPDAIQADIAAQRPGSQADDYFHATLFYGPMRVFLHSSMMTLSPGPALEAQGALGSFVKYGMDTQEQMLKVGGTPGDAGWGADGRRGVLTDISGKTKEIYTVPGNYLAWYEAVARAILDGAPNPVPPREAVAVMELLDAGFLSAREGRRISL